MTFPAIAIEHRVERRGGRLTRVEPVPVLVVDDDPHLRALLARTLAADGFAAVEADGAEAALELTDDFTPAAAIVDVRLPTVSGYELCRRLRERFGRALAIVLISGELLEPFDRVAGLHVGDDYVTKPFEPEELVIRLRRLLERSASRSAAAGNGTRLTPREHEVLQLLSDGLDQGEIATALEISHRTVAVHLERVLAKLGVHSRAQAVSLAFRTRLVDVREEPSTP